MGNFDYDIGIIGGGAAGLTVTSGAAQLGAKTLLVEKEPVLGGDCLHFGCVPSKTLIKSAHVYHLLKNPTRFGLPAVEVPPVDFKAVAARIKSVIDVIQVHDSEERFCDLGAKVAFGDPHFTDEHTISLDGKSISAAKWVISTGSSPVAPPIAGLDTTAHLTNREIFYLDHLPKSMIVLGAGPIGCEMGQAFNRLGCEVHIVDRAGQILVKEDKDMADQVQDVMAAEGVNFHLNVAIEQVQDIGNKKQVTLKTEAGQTKKLTAETILVAMGRGANTAGLGLDKIGVDYDGRGISVDERLRTSQKHIFAAGDVNGGFQFTHAAGYEGGIVISNAIFRLPRKTNFTFLPWCTFTDPPLGSIGMNEAMAKSAGINYRVISEAFKDNDRSLAEGHEIGLIKLLLNEKEKPIGVQILGPNAGDLLSTWAAVLNGGVKLTTLASAMHPYPTIGEINKRVAGTFLSPKIFSDKVKKGLKLFFNLKGRACSLDDEMEET